MRRMNPFAADPISALWTSLRSWLADALDECGPPAEVAAALARKARAAIRRRLAALETLLMKLLLIEAVRRTPDWRAPSAACRAKPGASGAAKAAAPARAKEDQSNPGTWRVRFRLRIPRDPQRPPPARPRDIGGPRIRDLGRPLLVRDIWREQARRALIARLHPKPDAAADQRRAEAKALKLARRFEALRRVIADPRRAVAALVRKLRALAAAAFAAARRIVFAQPPRGAPHRMIFAHAMVCAHDAIAGDTS
jgi:hypothetical protein